VGEVDPSWPPPRTDDGKRDSSAHSGSSPVGADEVDPNWLLRWTSDAAQRPA
jgi:hypothetical protein